MSSSPWPPPSPARSARRSPSTGRRRRGARPPRPPAARPWRPARAERGREVLVEHQLSPSCGSRAGRARRPPAHRRPTPGPPPATGRRRVSRCPRDGQDPEVDRELSRVAVPAGPSRIVRCPTASKSGAHASSAESGPEARTTSCPPRPACRVPSTGRRPARRRLLGERRALLDRLDPDGGRLPPDLPLGEVRPPRDVEGRVGVGEHGQHDVGAGRRGGGRRDVDAVGAQAARPCRGCGSRRGPRGRRGRGCGPSGRP